MNKPICVGLQRPLKEKLESMKIHPRESIGDVIERLIQEHEQRVEFASALDKSLEKLQEHEKVVDSPAMETSERKTIFDIGDNKTVFDI